MKVNVKVNVKESETYLPSCETNGYDAEVCGVREELGFHHGGVHLDDLVINGVYVVESELSIMADLILVGLLQLS